MTFFFFLLLFFTRDILTGNLLIYISHFSFIKSKTAIVSLTILFLSLAGLPPFLGFFSKFFIFTGILFINHIFIILFFIVYSLYSAIYYLRIIKQLFFLHLKKSNIKYVFLINKLLKLIVNIFIFFLISSFYTTNLIFNYSYLIILYATTI